MAKSLRTSRQTWCLFAALVIGAVLIAICGAQWIQRGFNWVHVLSFSHDSTKFVAQTGGQLSHVYKFGIFDSSNGELLFEQEHKFYSHLSWSNDDTKLVGLYYNTLTGNRTIEVLEVTGSQPNLLRTWSTESDQTDRVFFDSRNNVVQINRTLVPVSAASATASVRKPLKRNRLDLVLENEEVMSSIEFGLNEAATLLSGYDPNYLSIRFTAHPTMKNPDLVFTSKEQRRNVVQFDRSTAAVLRQLGNRDVDDFDSTTTYDYSKKSNSIAIHRGDSVTPVLEVPREWTATRGPVAIGSDYFLMYDNIYAKSPKLFKAKEGPFDHPVIPAIQRAVPTPAGEAMLFTKAGKLVRLNAATGEQSLIKDFRPHAGIYKMFAITGVPLLWGFMYYAGTRRRSEQPIGEFALLILTTCVIFVSWSWFGSSGRSVQTMPALGLGYTILTAAVVFGLIWGYASQSTWGVVVPVGIIYVCIIFGVFAAWAAGDSARFVQAVMGALLIGVWQAFILFGFRRLVGRVGHAELTASQQTHQFTLRQGLYFIGSVAVLLAIVQFLRWEVLNLPEIVSSVIFLFGFGAVLTIPATFAMWITFRMDNPIWSCLLSLLTVVVASLIYHTTEGFPPKTLQDTAFFYGPSLIVAFIVWVGIRYCRAHGFRLVKS